MSNKLDLDYQMLLKDILENGIEKETRNGNTISVFGRQIRHNMKDGFPLLTTKKMAVKTMMTELKWFLKGDTNIKYLVDNGCNIWNGDAYKNNYAKLLTKDFHGPRYNQEQFIDLVRTNPAFAKDFGELGPIYGAQWRDWNGFEINSGAQMEGYNKGVDQIKNLIEQLKTNPDSRRLMVNSWNVSQISEMTLPPCHYGFQMYTRELTFHERWSLYSDKPYDGNGLGMINTLDFMDDEGIPTRSISLMWNQRSVDTFLGLPFNIASYGLLLELIAKEVNMIPDELIGNLGDVHLYSNHLDQAKKQIMREPYNLPVITKLESNLLEGEFDCDISYYECWPAIKAPLSN